MALEKDLQIQEERTVAKKMVRNLCSDYTPKYTPVVSPRSLRQPSSSTPSNSLESGGLYRAQMWELDDI